MIDEEIEKKQIEKNAKSFVTNHFGNMPLSRQKVAERVYLLIVRDGIIY